MPSFAPNKLSRSLMVKSAIPFVLLLLIYGPGLVKSLAVSRKPLLQLNPTSYVFHVNADSLQQTLWHSHCYYCEVTASHCSNDEGLSVNSLRTLVMQPPFWQTSDVYFSFGAPLDYAADYNVEVVPRGDSTTEVSVHTSNSRVRIAPAFAAAHSGDLLHPVAPTTVEEYKFLLTLGCEVNEMGMPPLQLPK